MSFSFGNGTRPKIKQNGVPPPNHYTIKSGVSIVFESQEYSSHLRGRKKGQDKKIDQPLHSPKILTLTTLKM
jgi:hypothetical protein